MLTALHAPPRFHRGIRATVFALGALLVVCTAAQAQPPGAEKARLTVEADLTAYRPGDTVGVLVMMEIDSGWHTNSHQPTHDYLIATELALHPPQGWPEATVHYPAGELKSFAFADEAISVYEGQLTIVASVEVPETAGNGPAMFEIELTYQACDDRSCLPPVTTGTTLEILIGPEGEPTSAAVTPIASRPAASAPTRQGDPGLFWMLILGLIGGLILNAMPCVLPVLSIKIFGLVKAAGHGRTEVVRGTLATSAGIVFSFWALALAAVLAKAGGAAVGWGVQFQEPMFVSALAVVVLLFCLNLWGVFEVPLPQRLATAAGGASGEGLAGHFTSGLFATLMATPCSAPFLGTAVGFALSQSAGTIFAIFTAVGLGMALPYLALAAAPGAARVLPKPGPWMDHLRVTMGFLLAAAAVWLLYVLAAQISSERLAFFQLALLVMALIVWWRQTVVERPWAKRLAMATAIACAVGAVALVTTAESGARGTVSETPTLIDWVTFDRQEAERLASDGRFVFVDVTADWCFTCKVNERLALETEVVAEVFARHEVVAMKADWTNRSEPIARFLADHGRYGIPFYLLYRPGQETHLFGELITPQEIVEVVEAAGTQRVTSF